MRIAATRLIICGLLSSAAWGCGGSSGPSLSAVEKSYLGGIASYDENDDDIVTCDEWRAAADRLFQRADRTSSGALTQADYPNLASIDRTYAVVEFKNFDTNGDGKIDRKEFVERPNPAFQYADKDKDCKLTELELLTARSLSGPPKKAKAATDPNLPSPTTPTGGGGY